MTEQLLTLNEVALRLRVKPSAVNYLRRRRALACVRLSPQMIRYRSADVDEFIRERHVPRR